MYEPPWIFREVAGAPYWLLILLFALAVGILVLVMLR
jgi:hypothetical protein